MALAASAGADPSDTEVRQWDSAGNRLASHLTRTTRLIGNPGGWRSRLEALGIGLQLFYNQYLGWKPEGGGANDDAAFGHSASYDFFALVDVEEAAGWRGLDLLLHVKGQYDRNVNDDVGALSDPIDDADFDEPIYVDELWLQQALFDDRLRLRLGFLEQQTLFDRNAYANSEDRQFLASALDNNPLVPLPNGLGAALMARPTGALELVLGAADADNLPRQPGFDTAFDDAGSLTGYLEVTLRTRIPSPAGPMPGAYRAGTFVDGREKPVFGGSGSERGHWGAYASVDQLAYREHRDAEEGLGLFARFGYADPDTNALAWFWSLGFEYRGLLPCRGDDVLGVGSYQAIASGRYQEQIDPDLERETGIEVYYRIEVLPWLALTPDFQYLIDPGAGSTARDAAIGVLRFRGSF